MKSRLIIVTLCFLMVAMAMSSPTFSEESPIRVLFLTKSSGFEHSVVARGEKGELAHAEKIMLQLGKEHNMQVVVTKDGSMINKHQLAHFDVVQLYTTGDLRKPSNDGGMPMTQEGLEAFVEWVRQGGGLAAMHTAADTFQQGGESIFDPYRKLVGGVFKTHGSQEEAELTVEKDHPIVSHIDSPWELKDEYYIFTQVTNTFTPLLMLNTKSMQQEQYNQMDPYAITWIEKPGEGRVFNTSLGHREDVWTNPVFQKMLVKGIKWAAKALD